MSVMPCLRSASRVADGHVLLAFNILLHHCANQHQRACSDCRGLIRSCPMCCVAIGTARMFEVNQVGAKSNTVYRMACLFSEKTSSVVHGFFNVGRRVFIEWWFLNY